MRRHLCARFLVVIILAGVILPPRFGEAVLASKPLQAMPVTGPVADGGTFQGRLTVHTLLGEPNGQLEAMGSVTGALLTPGVATPMPRRSFTARVTLLDRRGPCVTAIVAPEPIVLTRLEQQVTLEPVLVGLRTTAAPGPPRRATLCAVPPLQD